MTVLCQISVLKMCVIKGLDFIDDKSVRIFYFQEQDHIASDQRPKVRI